MKKVNVKGVIIPNDDQWIYDYFSVDATSPASVSKQLENANGDEIEVDINSGGGDVFSGSEIYTALKSYKGNVIVNIVGIAASAASVIAMAGKIVKMSPTAQMMIHNVSSYAAGDYRDMNHTAELLKTANDTIANAYILKTGIERKELLKMMDNETFMNAQQAKEKGFVDEIMFDSSLKLAASIVSIGLLPQSVLDKMRNERTSKEKLNNKELGSPANELDFLITKQSLLRLKGEI